LTTRLQYLFELLEADRIRLIEKISELPSEQFNHTPPGKWSIHQILAHLIITEKLSLQYMRKKILGIHQTSDSGIMEEGKMAMLWLSQRLPFKFKAPKIVVEQTPLYSAVNHLSMEWEKDRQELKAFLETFENHQLKKKIYKHVRAGMLNIQHALLFYREHYLHHLPQIKRLL
jgi:uncharacterized damage-inducible protein DinB